MCSLCFQRRNRRIEKIINLKPLEPRRPSLREREREEKKAQNFAEKMTDNYGFRTNTIQKMNEIIF